MRNVLKSKINENRGITLIALVITIIVLLILASVSLAVILQNNGTIKSAIKAKEETEISKIEELANLEYTSIYTRDITKKPKDIMSEVAKKLTEDGYSVILDSNNIVTKLAISDENVYLVPTSEEGDKTKDVEVKLVTEADKSELNYLVTVNKEKYRLTYANGKVVLKVIESSSEPKINTVTVIPKEIVTNGSIELVINGEKITDKKTINITDKIIITVSSTRAKIEDLKEAFEIELKNSIDESTSEAKLVKISVEKIYDFCLNDYNYAQAGITREGNVIIPKTFRYNGRKYKIKTISRDAFQNCNKLTSVTIPSSVTEIEEYYNSDGAFRNCTSLELVTIEAGIEKIGHYAFKECTSLKTINIPNSVISIGDSAFSGCTALTSIDIPDSVTNLGSSVFWGCKSLNEVKLSNQINSIKSGTFSQCKGLTSVDIPYGITSIGSDCFAWCSNLKTVNIPNTVKIIGGSAFYDSINLHMEIPNSVTRIAASTFIHGKNMEITLPDTITYIGRMAFGDNATGKIIYKGTKEQWNNIEKDTEWNKFGSVKVEFLK